MFGNNLLISTLIIGLINFLVNIVYVKYDITFYFNQATARTIFVTLGFIPYLGTFICIILTVIISIVTINKIFAKINNYFRYKENIYQGTAKQKINEYNKFKKSLIIAKIFKDEREIKEFINGALIADELINNKGGN